MRLSEVEENPYILDKTWKARHYSAEIYCGTRRATFYFSQGVGVHGLPELTDILESLLLDSALSESSLKDYMDDMAIPAQDYPEARQTHVQLRRTHSKLRRLFKDQAVFDEFRSRT